MRCNTNTSCLYTHIQKKIQDKVGMCDFCKYHPKIIPCLSDWSSSSILVGGVLIFIHPISGLPNPVLQAALHLHVLRYKLQSDLCCPGTWFVDVC